MIINRNIPTGFAVWDIILGENERNLKGELIDIRRGYPLGEQGIISAVQAAGKSTLAVQSTAFAIKMGYPCHKIIIFDSDGGSHKLNRLVNLTGMEPDEVNKYYKVYTTSVLEEVISIIEKEHQEYMDMKYKPVKFFDPIRQEEVKMMPYVMILVDTVTSLKAGAYDVDGKSSLIANETDLTTFRYTANLTNSITNFFDKNIAVLWISHLKANNPAIGQSVAEKDYKSTQNNKKASVPARLKFKASWSIWLNGVNDGANQESSSHPIKEYALEDAEGNSAFSVSYIAAKSRTGTEGRTKGTLIFMDAKFDRSATLVADAKNLGVFKVKGQYPNADEPSIFKGKPDAEHENAVMGMKRKAGLVIDGYDRTTNILESRLLLNYTGDDEELIDRQAMLYSALMNGLEKKLAYELESNCVTQEELDNNNKKLSRMFSYMNRINRIKVIEPGTKIEMPEQVDLAA